MGSSLLISTSEAGANERALVIENVIPAGGEYKLVVSTATPLIDGGWIKFATTTGIADANGTPVHAENRRVQIFQTEVPPNLTESWYVTYDATGRLDFAYLVFDKKPKEGDDLAAWFEDGWFKFNWVDGKVTDSFGISAANLLPTNITRNAGGDTITINLKTTFAKALGTNVDIMTSGNMYIEVSFNPRKGWPVLNQLSQPNAARKLSDDRARPVLMSAALQIGSMSELGEPLPDIMTIVYSEGMDVALNLITQPVSVWSSGSWVPLNLRFVDRATPPGSVTTVVTYSLESNIQLRTGDSVRINDVAAVTDLLGNVQNNPANRRVLLDVKAGDINWRIKIKNNPFRDSTTVVMTPNFKGESRKFTAQIKLYDNMGRLVNEWEIENKQNDPVDGSALTWVWNGRNRQGRVVGTGTYIFKSVCSAAPTPEEPTPGRWIRSEKIAFVRGIGR
jgi:hypothetical protein